MLHRSVQFLEYPGQIYGRSVFLLTVIVVMFLFNMQRLALLLDLLVSDFRFFVLHGFIDVLLGLDVLWLYFLDFLARLWLVLVALVLGLGLVIGVGLWPMLGHDFDHGAFRFDDDVRHATLAQTVRTGFAIGQLCIAAAVWTVGDTGFANGVLAFWAGCRLRCVGRVFARNLCATSWWDHNDLIWQAGVANTMLAGWACPF